MIEALALMDAARRVAAANLAGLDQLVTESDRVADRFAAFAERLARDGKGPFRKVASRSQAPPNSEPGPRKESGDG